jgi:hypothetical protein
MIGLPTEEKKLEVKDEEVEDQASDKGGLLILSY